MFPRSPAGRTALAWLSAGLMACLATTARGQSPPRNIDIQRPPDFVAADEFFGGLESTRDEEGTTFAPESPGDEELGEQALLGEDTYEPLTISFQAQGMFTTNAGLTETNELEDFYLYSDLDLRYIPRLGEQNFGVLAASYGLYRYSDHGVFDFDSLETSAGFMRLFPELGNLVGWVSYEFTRLTEGRGSYDSLLNEHSIQLGLYYPAPIGERQFAFASCLSEFSLGGGPDFARRDEHGLTLGYAFLPMERLGVSAYYQAFVYDYTGQDRLDLYQDIGVGLQWKMFDHAFIGLLARYSFNDSDVLGGDYTAGRVGATLNVAFQF